MALLCCGHWRGKDDSQKVGLQDQKRRGAKVVRRLIVVGTWDFPNEPVSFYFFLSCQPRKALFPNHVINRCLALKSPGIKYSWVVTQSQTETEREPQNTTKHTHQWHCCWLSMADFHHHPRYWELVESVPARRSWSSTDAEVTRSESCNSSYLKDGTSCFVASSSSPKTPTKSNLRDVENSRASLLTRLCSAARKIVNNT